MLRDRDIREPLFDFLEDTYGRIRILEELGTGRSRADIVMVTEDMLVGIEIKSDADTYARLSRQIKDYDRVYNRNIVVVGTTHAMHIEEHVPSHWGIVTVEEAGNVLDFYVLRKPKDNPKASLKSRLSLLWKTELYKIQLWADMPKYKDKSRDFVVSKILERFPDPEDEHILNRKVSGILFERDYSTIEEELAEYKKGELQKKIEAEIDPQRRLELMMEQAERRKNFKRRR